MHTQQLAAITAAQGGKRAHNRDADTAARTGSELRNTSDTEHSNGSLQSKDAPSRSDAPQRTTDTQQTEHTKRPTQPSAASKVAMFFILRNKHTVLMALQNLYKSRQAIDKASAKLATGHKINSSSDDAAGSAIASRMGTRLAGLRQANSNASEGMSLTRTAANAIMQINSNLQRIRELAVKSANDTLSKPDLKALQSEIDALKADIDRISDNAHFNKIELLNKHQALKIQVGAASRQSVVVNLPKMNSKTLHIDDLMVVGYDGQLTPVQEGIPNDNAPHSDDPISGLPTTRVRWASGQNQATPGDNHFTLLRDDRGHYFVRRDDNSSNDAPVYAVKDILDVSATETLGAHLLVTADGTGSVSQKTSKPLARIDAALQRVATTNSRLGATQNHLNAIIDRIATQTLGLTSARSRIVDTDYATAITQLSHAQIMQDANIAVLAQANQTSRGVSSLLGGHAARQ